MTKLQGLEKHGIGRWREIGEEFLPRWDDQAIRVKASRLMGTQSLARYIGWKGDRLVTSIHAHDTAASTALICTVRVKAHIRLGRRSPPGGGGGSVILFVWIINLQLR